MREPALAHAPIGEIGAQPRIGFDVAVVRGAAPFLGVQHARAAKRRGAIRGLGDRAAGRAAAARLLHDLPAAARSLPGAAPRPPCRAWRPCAMWPPAPPGAGPWGDIPSSGRTWRAAESCSLVHRAPIRQGLAGMIHGGFHIDERLVAQLVDHAEQRFARSLSRFLPSANARTPSASQYEASAGMPSRMCSAAAPFMMAFEPGLQLPGALARGDDERAARRAAPCRLETMPECAARDSRTPCRAPCRRAPAVRACPAATAPATASPDLFAAEVGQVEEALHAGIFASASLS
jgi:hypothetical protein